MNLSDFARAMGRKGGQARARKLSAAQKQRIAARGGRSRAQSLQAARRITENFRYLEVIRDLAGAPKVKRLRNVKLRLPGLYG